MVTLTNITKTNNIIECDYYPEYGENPGHIAFDIDKGIVELKYADFEYGILFSIDTYVHFAAKRLSELFHQKTIPEKDIVMWY